MWRLYFQIQYITLKSQRLKLAKSELRGKKINNLKNVKISFLKSPHNREEWKLWSDLRWAPAAAMVRLFKVLERKPFCFDNVSLEGFEIK